MFLYLDAFCTPDAFPAFLPEYQCLDELKDHYRRGGLGDVQVKRFLEQVLQARLSPIRQRRKYGEDRLPEVYDILRLGSEKARVTAAATLNDVREAMKLNYFG